MHGYTFTIEIRVRVYNEEQAKKEIITIRI